MERRARKGGVRQLLRRNLAAPVGARLEELRAIRSKWPLPTRLGTRTKESNVHASVKVEKPSRGMKVSDAIRAASADPVGWIEYERVR